MKQSLISLFTLSAITLFTHNSFAQTTTINYQTWTPPPQCNAFASPTVVSNTTHNTTVGEPSYDSINQGIYLECKDIYNGIPKGTEYQIDFNFKQNYSYKIFINAASIRANFTDPDPSLQLRLNNGANGSNPSIQCDGPDPINVFPIDANQAKITISGKFFLDYTLQFNALSGARSKMLVAAIPQANGYASILIRKITIEEIAPPPSGPSNPPPPSSFSSINSPPPAWCAPASRCLSQARNGVVVGDFNGDGRTDFLSANSNFDIWLANPDGSVRYAYSVPAPFWCAPASNCLSQNQNGVVVGDFNGDGRTDFLSTNGNFDAWLATTTGAFTPILAAPAPSWCTPASNCLSQNQNGVVVGDFNGDGRTDFLSANGNFDAWLATATGTFTPILAAPAPSWCTPASRCLSQNQNGVVVGDFNGDGRTDFLSANGNFDIWLAK